jgi:SAM-dependent methyltransferase
VGRHSLLAAEFAVSWSCENARHTDCLVAQALNVWRDGFPPGMEQALIGQQAGFRYDRSYRAGAWLPDYDNGDCLPVRRAAFRGRCRGNFVEPRAGRFYPKGMIAGVRGILPEDRSPMRVVECGDALQVDLNHPLAGREIRLSTRVLDVRETGGEHGGRRNDIVALMAGRGPGMQARWRDRPTDFWADIPFARTMPGPDGDFYALSRLVNHVDSTASARIGQLYQGLIPMGGRVLDLMASWNSHLTEKKHLGPVTGLGMNREELDANPVLAERCVHDLNEDPVLPFADGSFEAVICTVSVEYLVRPLDVFAEVHRVLAPGGIFIVTFSNRWFPPKVVKVWTDIHEFERPGLVLEYFLRNGGFSDLETFSLRGLPRPADDKYAGQLAESDPVYAVWGVRRS